MSAEASIYIEDDIETESSLGFYNRSFINEICQSNFYMNLKDILSKEELEIIYPLFYEEDSRVFISPLLLYKSFKKIYSYLVNNKDLVPMYHEIYASVNSYDQVDWVESCLIISKNVEYSIDGNICRFKLLFEELRHRFPELLDKDYFIKYQKYFNVLVYNPDLSNLVRIKAEPIIRLGEKEFKTRSFYKYQQYELQINDILNICQKAINLNKRIVWYFY